MSGAPRPPDFWRNLSAEPSPPRLEREEGPREVNLPLEAGPRRGAFPFDFWGRVAIELNPPDPWENHPVEFTVPDQLEGIALGIAAGAAVAWYSDEFAVELFVDRRPQLGELVVNEAAFTTQAAALSSDLSQPTPIFVPLPSGAVVYVAAARGVPDVNQYHRAFPPTSVFCHPFLDARLTGRFWPKTLGRSPGQG